MSLINEALKQTRGEASRTAHNGTMGMPVTHPRNREGRSFRTDIFIVAAVLLLLFLVFGGAALLYLTKTRDSQPLSVPGPIAPVVTPAAAPAAAPISAVDSGNLPHPGLGTPKTAEPPSRAIIEKLRVSLAVTAIMGSGDSAMALVNSRIVKVGDRIEGAVIAAIGADTVTLELDGEKAELVLK